MPQKNSIKRYYENGFYHIYNRGVEKRKIFLDRKDYLFFLHLLKTGLSEAPKKNEVVPLDLNQLGSDPVQGPTLKRMLLRSRKNFFKEIDLLCYCLMPNHYHFLIRQQNPRGITEFIRSISTAYSMYFNKKYQRVGSLFQGKFKAIDIQDEGYLIWISRYIHRNPANFQNYPYSSYNDYLDKRNAVWLNPSILLEYFSPAKFRQIPNYQKFVEDKIEVPIDLEFLIIDSEEQE